MTPILWRSFSWFISITERDLIIHLPLTFIASPLALYYLSFERDFKIICVFTFIIYMFKITFCYLCDCRGRSALEECFWHVQESTKDFLSDKMLLMNLTSLYTVYPNIRELSTHYLVEYSSFSKFQQSVSDWKKMEREKSTREAGFVLIFQCYPVTPHRSRLGYEWVKWGSSNNFLYISAE